MWRMFCMLEAPESGAESSCPETCQLHIYLPYRIWGTGPRPPTDFEDFQPQGWILKKAHVRHELAGREKSRLWGQKKIRPEEKNWGEGFLICWQTSARESERRKFSLQFAIHRRPWMLFFSPAVFSPDGEIITGSADRLCFQMQTSALEISSKRSNVTVPTSFLTAQPRYLEQASPVCSMGESYQMARQFCG